MAQDTLNSFEEKGLACPFVASKSGTIEIASRGESIKNEIVQMTTVIFETLGAIGDFNVDKIEILADTKGLIMTLDQDSLTGNLFDQSGDVATGDMWTALQELKDQIAGTLVQAEVKKERPAEKLEEKPAEKVVEKPKEKPKVKLDSAVLDDIKKIIKDYLGDFSERIFKNQLKAQRIKTEEFYDADARRLIFGLGKAAGMIIGPSKGQTMTNKLLELLK
jgi:hypothetical protein